MADWDPEANELFLRAVEIASPADRRRFVDGACAGKPDLRARVDGLIRAGEQAGSFLEHPALDSGPTSAHSPWATGEAATAPPGAGAVVGPYKLVQEIGEGGMGTVYLAQQTEPVRRVVAIKLVKPGMDSRQVLARFEAERQALAMMDHPNIARVLDAGATPEGRPYFVMELVKGVPITRYCDDHRLGVRIRLELFAEVCRAVQHAHQKGVIHRDLKPSNVLVAPYDGKPVVKVIDFGVAKAAGQPLTDRTLVTGLGAVVGTPEYMSPEQAELNNLDIDTRSDIYALGVLLYELLTGSTPLTRGRVKEVALLEVLRLVREEEPPRPSVRLSTTEELPSIAAVRAVEPAKLSRLVRGDLDWIVMRALEKDRNRRYETANALALDIQRFLTDEPIQACPPSAWYRLRKFARRNRTALAIAGLIGFFLLVLGGGAAWVVRERAARQGRLARDLELALDRAELFQAEGKRADALAALDRAELLVAQDLLNLTRSKRLAALKERLAAEARDQEFLSRYEEIGLNETTLVDTKESRFRKDTTQPAVEEALRRYGIGISEVEPARVSALVQGRPERVRRTLLAALDECLSETKEAEARNWLFSVLDVADTDPWRVQMRKAGRDGDRQTVERLAREVDVRRQDPGFLRLVARSLPAKVGSSRIDLLRRIQRAYPADLWANLDLAMELIRKRLPAEAVRYLTVAVALRPDNPGLYVNRSGALYEAGETKAALEDDLEALALAPNYAMAHNNLGLLYIRLFQYEKGITHCSRAIELNPKNALAWSNRGDAYIHLEEYQKALADCTKGVELDPQSSHAWYLRGAAYCGLNQYEKALADFLKALDLDPEDAPAYYNMAFAHAGMGNLKKAIAAYREAIRLNPTHAEAHVNLGVELGKLGRFTEALPYLRRGHELGSRKPGWPYHTAWMVQECERQIEIERRFQAFLDGTWTPSTPAERIDLAHQCYLKKRHVASAHLYEEAFAKDPKLATDLDAAHRYNAACAAALAGSGQGNGADTLDGEERAVLRRQAHDWLRADLMASRTLLEKGSDKDVPLLAGRLQHWLVDPDFTGVREPESLAKWPDDERLRWRQLWGDVAQAQARARVRRPSDQKSGAR